MNIKQQYKRFKTWQVSVASSAKPSRDVKRTKPQLSSRHEGVLDYKIGA